MPATSRPPRTPRGAVVREPTLRLAFKDLGFSLRDRGDDAFLYAYRAVENARRFHADKLSATETTPDWPPLHAALGTSEGQLQPLTAAATSIRHGDTKSAALAAAHVNRDATLALAEDILATRSARGRELIARRPSDVG